MKTSSSSFCESLKSGFGASVSVIALTIGFIVWKFVLGNPSHFVGRDPENHPLQGDYFGIFYKGGPLVPLAIGLVLMVLTFAIERIVRRIRS